MSGSSKQEQTSNSKSVTNPWDPQAGALKTAFSGASDAYKQANSAVAPTDFVAGMTPEQLSTFRNMLGYASNGTDNANAAGDAGVGMLSAGAGGVQGALSDLDAFNPANTYNTDAVLSKARQYADNPAVSGMVDSAMRDAKQSVRDVVLPGISANAALSGNTNSSRTGIAEGLVERGLAQKTADVSSDLRGQLYDRGLELGTNELQENNASVLDALKSRGALGSEAFAQGGEGVSRSISDQGNLFSLAGAGGSGLQGADQLNLDNLLARYQSSVSSPFDAEQALMSIIGTNNWGGTTKSSGTSTTTATPSAWQVIGGLMGAAGSGAKGLGSMGFTPFAAA
jgi:hypothetical protein